MIRAATAALGVLTVASAFLAPAENAWPKMAIGPQIGRVVSVGEGATYELGRTHSKLVTGDPIYAGIRIDTGSAGAILLLHEGTIQAALKLKPETALTIRAVAGGGIQTDLEHGMILSDVHNPDKRPTPYIVRTRTAVMGVRGTVFFVKEEPGKDVFLCTCSGEVSVHTGRTTATAETFKGTHHDHPVLIHEGDGSLASRTSPAPMGSDHTDAEGAELEKVLAAGA